MWEVEKYLDFKSHKLPDTFPDSYIWPREVIINDEQQEYLPKSQFSYDEEGLTITASRRMGQVTQTNQPWLSGMFTTHGTEWIMSPDHHERITARIRFPAQAGAFAALWAIPEFSQWPAEYTNKPVPENDIVENHSGLPGIYYATTHHYDTPNGQKAEEQFVHSCPEVNFADFNEYSMSRDPQTGTNRYWLNGQVQKEFNTPADLSGPLHFIINLAVGGSWADSLGNKVSSVVDTLEMTVDSMMIERMPAVINPNQDVIDRLVSQHENVCKCSQDYLDAQLIDLG